MIQISVLTVILCFLFENKSEITHNTDISIILFQYFNFCSDRFFRRCRWRWSITTPPILTLVATHVNISKAQPSKASGLGGVRSLRSNSAPTLYNSLMHCPRLCFECTKNIPCSRGLKQPTQTRVSHGTMAAARSTMISSASATSLLATRILPLNGSDLTRNGRHLSMGRWYWSSSSTEQAATW